jgi:hypothetical protein
MKETARFSPQTGHINRMASMSHLDKPILFLATAKAVKGSVLEK